MQGGQGLWRAREEGVVGKHVSFSITICGYVCVCTASRPLGRKGMVTAWPSGMCKPRAIDGILSAHMSHFVCLQRGHQDRVNGQLGLPKPE